MSGNILSIHQRQQFGFRSCRRCLAFARKLHAAESISQIEKRSPERTSYTFPVAANGYAQGRQPVGPRRKPIRVLHSGQLQEAEKRQLDYRTSAGKSFSPGNSPEFRRDFPGKFKRGRPPQKVFFFLKDVTAKTGNSLKA
jgi:hypothetical protein